jgi:hypothetical protein
MSERFTSADFASGLLYAIASRPLTSLRTGPRLDAGLLGAYARLRQLESDYGIDVRFAAVADEFGQSEALSYSLSAALLRGLFSYDYDDILIDRRRIHAVVDLADLPATPELYEELASAFFTSYNHVPSLVK